MPWLPAPSAMQYERKLDVNRWMVYFDLLGTRSLLASRDRLQVFVVCNEAIRQCQRSAMWTNNRLKTAWFSDTFLILAPNGSKESFKDLSRMARIFAYFLIQKRIPLQGAISCNRLYADFNERVFFGSALVEAYEYADGQDWIGLVLCPSAKKRLNLNRFKSPDVGEERSYYVFHKVPWRRSHRPDRAPAELPTCVIGNWLHENIGSWDQFIPGNPCIPTIKEMMSRCGRDNVRMKYKRTLTFLKKNQRSQNGLYRVASNASVRKS